MIAKTSTGFQHRTGCFCPGCMAEALSAMRALDRQSVRTAYADMTCLPTNDYAPSKRPLANAIARSLDAHRRRR